MKQILIAISLFFSIGMISQTLKSPDGKLSVRFKTDASGRPNYSVDYKETKVIEESFVGLLLKDGTDMSSGFEIAASETSSFDESWTPVLGEVDRIRNHYNELDITLIKKSGHTMIVRFRAFNEGIAFRYEFPKQKNLNYFIVKQEKTEFNLTADHKAFWIPGDFDSQEYAYNETRLSGIDVDKLDMNNGIGFKGPMLKTRVPRSFLSIRSTARSSSARVGSFGTRGTSRMPSGISTSK